VPNGSVTPLSKVRPRQSITSQVMNLQFRDLQGAMVSVAFMLGWKRQWYPMVPAFFGTGVTVFFGGRFTSQSPFRVTLDAIEIIE
jgi:hypothetical protein